jgi:uncharacterized protein (DUF2147 family)
MTRFFAASALALSLSAAVAAQAPDPMLGVWRQDDGAATVRIAPCASGPDNCATVIDERPQPGETSRLGKVTVKNIRPAGAMRWTGVFVDQGATFGAKIRQLSSTAMTFKICALAFLCETKRFQRVSK